MHHYLRPLVEPDSVALVGASERPGSIGRIVLENLQAAGYKGAIHPVNPRHASVLDRRAYSSLADIGSPVDLALIATPAAAVVDVLDSAASAKLKVAVVMTAPDVVGTREARAWSRDVASAAKRNRVRVVGPGALGVIRPGIGLDATYCAPTALPGRLALIAQSGAVATAMLDFATPLGIGFSTVVSLGGGIDVGFGELLDLVLLDPVTEGILIYVEDVGDARGFLSALRAAARTKPVVVLKAGRGLDSAAHIAADAVFNAALMRAGTVRVQTYTQLFAAARILSRGKIPQGDRVAIVSNGRGPALLAVDAAADRALRLASFTRDTQRKLEALVGDDLAHVNPVDVRGDSSAERLAGAVEATLADPNVDAVVALHVPRPAIPPLEGAGALAAVAKTSPKPVLAAWMGAVDRQEVHAALESGHVSNFFTPENAVDALSFLVAYRNNQQWLLEVPPPQPEPEPIDLAPLEALRMALVDEDRTELRAGEAAAVLHAFGIGRYAVADSLAAARHAITELRFPLTLELDASSISPRLVIGMRRSLPRAWNELQQLAKRNVPDAWSGRVVIREASRSTNAPTAAIEVATDRRFGPVIALRPGIARNALVRRRGLMLPPLNARLAHDLLSAAVGDEGCASIDPSVVAPLVDALIRISAMVCALPWVVRAEFDPVVVEASRLVVAGMRIEVDPRRKLLRGYPHMAIHPYPVELIGDVELRDGTALHVRPIRPEDAALEREFVHGLSEQTRFYRFFYRLNELTPAMLARFTQVDYDRELALVALAAQEGTAQAFVGIARYIANPDDASAEFAVVVTDAWQRRGVARVLMKGLIVCAKRRGFERLVGTILRVNEPMIAFVRSLGFAVGDDPEDLTQVFATLPL